MPRDATRSGSTAMAGADRPDVRLRPERMIPPHGPGPEHDEGYPLCVNLLAAVKAGYSYGISGYDGWGCDVSRQLHVPVHQYDCFDLRVPSCPGGDTVFHGECIAPTKFTEDGRPFDTFSH